MGEQKFADFVPTHDGDSQGRGRKKYTTANNVSRGGGVRLGQGKQHRIYTGR